MVNNGRRSEEADTLAALSEVNFLSEVENTQASLPGCFCPLVYRPKHLSSSFRDGRVKDSQWIWETFHLESLILCFCQRTRTLL